MASSTSSSSSSSSSSSTSIVVEEHFDILDKEGNKTGVARPRSEVHALGLYHRAVHVWLYVPTTGELVLQKRATCKDSWPDRWDISSAGHVSAGEESRPTCQREVEEELGLHFPSERFQFLFTHVEILDSVQRGKPFLNHEFNDVYLITLSAEERAILTPENAVLRDVVMTYTIPPPTASEEGGGGGGGGGGGADTGNGNNSNNAHSNNTPIINTQWRLQASELSAVCYRHWKEVKDMYIRSDPTLVPTSDVSDTGYGRLFKHIEEMEAAMATERRET